MSAVPFKNDVISLFTDNRLVLSGILNALLQALSQHIAELETTIEQTKSEIVRHKI